MSKKKNEITVRSSAAEYLTYMAAVGDDPESIEVREEQIKLYTKHDTQRMKENNDE